MLSAATKDSKVSPNRPPATPFGKLRLTTPAKTNRGGRAATAAAAAAADASDTSPGTAVVSPLAKLGLNTPMVKGRPVPSDAQAPVSNVPACC